MTKQLVVLVIMQLCINLFAHAQRSDSILKLPVFQINVIDQPTKPEGKDFLIVSNSIKSIASGFCISDDGLIATCYHVIEGSKTIKVKGLNGDFKKEFSAIPIVTDKDYDIAILKIDDPSFISAGVTPYAIKSVSDDVGTSIFTLGFPLVETLGDEIKLTDGIINAKSGFKGDSLLYQISTAIQPGNSGGPLFDKDGYIIGIVNSKYLGAESVAYAIKSPYLLQLLNSIPTHFKMSTSNLISNMELQNQIKAVKNFVYLIEIY